MGNALVCFVGKGRVRLVTPDGKVEEFDYGIGVAELMNQYPNFMVVHCSTTGKALGARSKIDIMSPEEKLAHGQAYILCPIPPQYKQVYFKSLCEEKQSSRQTGSGAEATYSCEERVISNRLKIVVQCLIQILKSLSSAKVREEGSSPLLDSEQDISEVSLEEKQRACLPLDLYAWRPALEVIPESPYGYHDMPLSPFSFDKPSNLDGVPQSPRPLSPLGREQRVATFSSYEL